MKPVSEQPHRLTHGLRKSLDSGGAAFQPRRRSDGNLTTHRREPAELCDEDCTFTTAQSPSEVTDLHVVPEPLNPAARAADPTTARSPAFSLCGRDDAVFQVAGHDKRGKDDQVGFTANGAPAHQGLVSSAPGRTALACSLSSC